MKTVLITGCSAGGIGDGLAQAFQKRGWHVFASTRSVAKMTHLKELPNMTLLALDVTSQDSIAEALDSVKAKTGGSLDCLVNNAGVNCIGALIDEELDSAKALFDINVFGLMAVTKAFAPMLIAARGTIVNNSSVSAIMHLPFLGTYQASKAAVSSYSETLRLELKPFNVRVLCLHTGAVKTNIFDNFASVTISSKSLYLPLKPRMDTIQRGEHIGQNDYMTVSEYGRQVVAAVEAGGNGIIYRGGLAAVVHWVFSLFPGYLLDLGALYQNKLYGWKPKQD